MPAHGRNQTAQLLQFGEELMLIDCGEATQIRLRDFGLPALKINRIFISHLHGDHYFGLPGLLFTFHLLKRKAPLYVYAPPGLRDILTLQLKYSQTALNFPIEWMEWQPDSQSTLLETARFKVETIPLNHRIPCMGFLFTSYPEPYRRIVKGKLPKGLLPDDFKKLKMGMDIKDPSSGATIANQLVTKAPKPAQVYAYISDTLPLENHADLYRHANLLYHEATFMQQEQERSEATHHSTAKEAALLAKKAQVQKLILGHFSTRYRNLEALLEEARTIFPNTELALEGRRFDL
jgi:ribonuclease Z